MYEGDKAIFYDGSGLTLKRVVCTSRGCKYFFEELDYPINGDELEMLALPLLPRKKKILSKQARV
jgi:hypothetical protein